MNIHPQIFLSYARQDEEQIRGVYLKLLDAGCKPWMDTEDIIVGELWEDSIEKAIKHSDFFLAFLSKNSANKSGVLQKELKRALDVWQEKPESNIYLIPVRLDDCEVPEKLRRFQWVDLFKEGGWGRLVKAIQVGRSRQDIVDDHSVGGNQSLLQVTKGVVVKKEDKVVSVEIGNTVKVHYIGKFDDGQVFDSSESSDPLAFTVGDGQVIPGFDAALVGMQIGETKQVVIPAAQAYGERIEDLVQTINREQFRLGGIEPEVGLAIEMQTPQGSIPLVITELTEMTVTLDANHPLAGEELHFDITLIEIGTVPPAKGTVIDTVPFAEGTDNNFLFDQRIDVPFVDTSISPSPSSSRTLKVFLCHSSKDKASVRNLYNQLLTDNFSPWFDEEDLLPGQDWQLEIQLAVRNSDIILVCLSRTSTTASGFVQKEIKYALDIADQKPDGTIFIIPLKLEECDVPTRLCQWHWVNFFQDGSYNKLIKALKFRAATLDAVGAPTSNS